MTPVDGPVWLLCTHDEVIRLAGVTRDDLLAVLEQVAPDARILPVTAPPTSPPRLTLADLSYREREILHLIVGGFQNSEIADSLCLSVNTVKAHVRGLYRKLGVQNRAQAVRLALGHFYARGERPGSTRGCTCGGRP